MKRYSLYLILMLWSLLVSEAHATESPFDVSVETVSKIVYEPFSGLPSNQEFKITLEPSNSVSRQPDAANEGGSNRRFRLRIRPSDNEDFRAQGQRQNLTTRISSNSQRGRFRRVNNEYRQDFRVRNNNLRAKIFELTFSVVASQYADPGIYRLPLDVDLLDMASEEILNETKYILEITVGKKLQTNIAGANTNQNVNSRFAVVNFGVLKTGDSRRISIQIRGNTLADIKLSSENNGRLVHTRESDLFVNYSINVDGIPSELESPLSITRSIKKTLRGVAYPMDIIIGDAEDKFAGKYRDIITVEVRPK